MKSGRKNSNNLNVKADGLVRIQPQSYGTAATFATNGNVGIGAEATTPLAKLDVRGTISGSGDFLGTGVGNRITNNGTPYLLSGDSPAENDTFTRCYDSRQHNNDFHPFYWTAHLWNLWIVWR